MKDKAILVHYRIAHLMPLFKDHEGVDMLKNRTKSIYLVYDYMT